MMQSLSLKTKISLSVCCLVVALMSMGALVAHRVLEKEIKQIISDQQYALASSLAREIDDKLSISQAILMQTAHRLQKSMLADEKALQRFLDEAREAHAVFDDGLFLFSPSGILVAHSPYEPQIRGNDYSFREYYKQTLRTNRPYISRAYHSSKPHQNLAIMFTVPLFDAEDQLFAILGGSLDLMRNNFLGELSAIKIGQSGYLNLLSEDGTYVVRSQHNQALQDNFLKKHSDRGQILQGVAESFESDGLDGILAMVSVKKLRTANWVMSVHLPLHEADAPLGAMRGYLFGIFFGSIVLTILVVRWAMTRLMSPLAHFTQHVRDLSAKQGTERFFTTKAADEIGVLASTFNTMVDELEKQRRQLFQRQQHYQIISDFSTDMALWRAPHGDILYVSPQCQQITGYAAQAFYDDPLLLDNIIHPDDRALWNAYEPPVTAHSSSPPLEVRVISKSNALRWVSYSCCLVPNEQGELLGVRGSLSDITERKEMQEKIIEQKSLVEALLQNATVPLFVLDTHHHVISWNKACEQLTGVNKEKVIGSRKHWQAFYSHERPCLADMVLTGCDAGESSHYCTSCPNQAYEGLQSEGWYQRPDGEKRYIVVNAAPVRNEAGQLIAVIETLQDITARKKAEDELQASEENLARQHRRLAELFAQVEYAKREWERTFDCIEDIVIVIDSEGRIIRCNRATIDLTGASYTELLGRPWQTILPGIEEDAGEFLEQRRNVYDPSSGKWFNVSSYPFSLKRQHERTGAIISLHDTTQIKSVTEELQKAYQKLSGAQAQMIQAEKMASVGQLAAGVAHEINNPLGFITSNLSALGKYREKLVAFVAAQDQAVMDCKEPRVPEKLSALRKQLKIDYILDDIDHLVAESLEGAERMKKIVQDLKSFSRADVDESRLTNIVECLESTINIVWNELKYKATLDRQYGETPLILCNPQHLSQVFMNLLINAAHAIESQGTITVRSWHEDNAVYVRVSDTGCGMSEEVRTRIFEPFFSTREVGKGTGLGLSISYELIKKHQGEIMVESEPGKGSSFTVMLPVAC